MNYHLTNTEWTDEQEEKLWDLYESKATIKTICDELERFPDDILLKLMEEDDVTEEELHENESLEFCGSWHMILVKAQQKAFIDDPIFNLREQLRRRKFEKQVLEKLTNFK